ncbi:uncharacterized protein LOC111464574 isoform X2 [Cucurbita moschata]|uniref:Uncharacterized protein LOC111464574 isoform X2 n=1 Tax=Cucurbita moschata TaxID=3662 RepID=A0A6J1HLD7_CUCMO|nr:uncharacterized protein LOC111464574 isoform X2 [Cucurbita moschata]XP_022964614.1 uncharacterized protein LOC111464574 isoform X2 [Cucurbita moschata]
MASLAAHLSAALFLVPIGVRRLLCSSSVYIDNPSLYRSRTWYLSETKWKNFDIYSLILLLPIAAFSEIFLFLAFSGNPTYKFAFSHQSMAIFFFWALTILIILRENFDPLLVSESFIFVFAGIAFLIEYSVIGNGITGLGGAFYHLSSGLALLCACCCLYLSMKPSAFFAEFLLSSGLTFKGTWMFQIGLSLYTDAFALKGCRAMLVLPATQDAFVQCDLEEDQMRATSLLGAARGAALCWLSLDKKPC